jgi:hypothetical protein
MPDYAKNLIKKIVRHVTERKVRPDLLDSPSSMNYPHSDLGAAVSALVEERAEFNRRVSDLEILAHSHDSAVCTIVKGQLDE